MLVSMGLLASLCVFLGIFPVKVMMVINSVNTHLLNTNILPAITSYDWLHTKSVQTNFTELSPKSATVLGLMLLPLPLEF